MTDPTRWRLEVENGRQVWHYLTEDEAENWTATAYDKYWMEIYKVCHRIIDAIRSRLHYPLQKVHWNLPEMDINSIKNCRQRMAIGRVNMVAPCF